MDELITNILTSLGSGGLAGGVIIYLSRSWISERLKQSIEHEYQAKLESHKAILKTEHELAIEKFKVEVEKERAIKGLAAESVMSAREASQELRINAIKVLWEAVLTIKTNLPSYIGISDILVEKEWSQFKTHPPLQALLKDLDIGVINSLTLEPTKDVDKLRPFIGELIYSYFFAYRAFAGSILHSFVQSKEEKSFEPWFRKKHVIDLLKSSLGNEVVEEITSRSVGMFSAFQQEFEKQILQHCANVITGEEGVSFGVEQASKIQASASQLQANATKVPN